MLLFRDVKRLGSATAGHAAFVLIAGAAICVTHARWIFTHFSSDGYLQDSGWIAYLFASGDPLLHNPAGVNDLSFYAHHLSPHIFLLGLLPSRLLHLTGIQIVAVHQGVFFSLFFVALYLLIVPPGVQRRDRIGALLCVVLLGGLSNALFQAAGYPHYELYFALPWLLACVIWIAVFAGRSRRAVTTGPERVILLVAALALSAPIQAAAGARGQSWYVARWAFQRPVVNIESMKNFVMWVRQMFNDTTDGPRQRSRDCVSQGIAALVPNSD